MTCVVSSAATIAYTLVRCHLTVGGLVHGSSSEPSCSRVMCNCNFSWLRIRWNCNAYGKKYRNFDKKYYGRLRRQILTVLLVQYNTVQYSAVQCSTIEYVQHSTVQPSTIQHSAVQCSTIQYSRTQCSTVQYSAVQYITIQYSTVQCAKRPLRPSPGRFAALRPPQR